MFVTLIFGLFFLVGIGLTLYGLYLLRQARVSGGWPKVAGKITTAEVVERRDSDGKSSYAPNVIYEYRVGDRRYESTTIAFGLSASVHPNFNRQASAQALIKAYKPCSVVMVAYNPLKPDIAVLQPGNKQQARQLVQAGIVFTVMAAILRLFILWIQSR